MPVLDRLRDYRLWKWPMKFHDTKDEFHEYSIGFFANNKEPFDANPTSLH